MERRVFVAREQELEQLDSFINQALNSQGAVCFVTGEAGTGKTSLVNEFSRRVQERHHDLVVVVGQFVRDDREACVSGSVVGHGRESPMRPCDG